MALKLHIAPDPVPPTAPYSSFQFMDQPDHNSLINTIYAGILSPDGFNGGLQVVKDVFGIEMSYLILREFQTNLARVVGAAGMIPKFQADYESDYQFVDPGKEDFKSVPVGNWWIDSDRLGLARIKSGAFHQEFLRSYDFASFMVSPVFRSSETEVGLGLLRSRSEGAFTKAAAIQPYIPHLRRAVLLRERLGELTAAAQLTQSLVEHLPFGVAIIDCRLRVLSLNNRGRPWLTALGPPSRWRHRIPGSEYTFEHMIREACKPRDPAPVQAALLRGSKCPPCRLLVLPLAAGHRFSHGWQQPAALAIFSELNAPTRLLPSILRDLYSLSRSEARLALCMADGSPLLTAAATLGITRETARTTLKIVFRKTGVNSQSQLVRLLSVLTAIDAPYPAE